MRGLLAVLLASAFISESGYAQVTDLPRPVGEAPMLLVNAAIGGLTAGLFRSGARKSFWTGFARGAVAGTAVYAGKRLIGEGTAAGWWIGRHVASLGSSEVANAAHGRPILHSAVFPIGPVRFHVDRTAKRKVSPRLDLGSTIATVVISMKPGSRLALRESAATGTLVFIMPEVSSAIGGSTAGVLTLSELVPDGSFPPLESKRSVLSHEMVHAAQYDFGFTAWGDAMQSAISHRSNLGKRVSAFVDVNLVLLLQLGANSIIDYENRPWEREAASLARHSQ
jgi:hypothetical protein